MAWMDEDEVEVGQVTVGVDSVEEEFYVEEESDAPPLELEGFLPTPTPIPPPSETLVPFSVEFLVFCVLGVVACLGVVVIGVSFLCRPDIRNVEAERRNTLLREQVRKLTECRVLIEKALREAKKEDIESLMREFGNVATEIQGMKASQVYFEGESLSGNLEQLLEIVRRACWNELPDVHREFHPDKAITAARAASSFIALMEHLGSSIDTSVFRDLHGMLVTTSNQLSNLYEAMDAVRDSVSSLSVALATISSSPSVDGCDEMGGGGGVVVEEVGEDGEVEVVHEEGRSGGGVDLQRRVMEVAQEVGKLKSLIRDTTCVVPAELKAQVTRVVEDGEEAMHGATRTVIQLRRAQGESIPAVLMDGSVSEENGEGGGRVEEVGEEGGDGDGVLVAMDRSVKGSALVGLGMAGEGSAFSRDEQFTMMIERVKLAHHMEWNAEDLRMKRESLAQQRRDSLRAEAAHDRIAATQSRMMQAMQHSEEKRQQDALNELKIEDEKRAVEAFWLGFRLYFGAFVLVLVLIAALRTLRMILTPQCLGYPAPKAIHTSTISILLGPHFTCTIRYVGIVVVAILLLLLSSIPVAGPILATLTVAAFAIFISSDSLAPATNLLVAVLPHPIFLLLHTFARQSLSHFHVEHAPMTTTTSTPSSPHYSSSSPKLKPSTPSPLQHTLVIAWPLLSALSGAVAALIWGLGPYPTIWPNAVHHILQASL